MLFKKKTLEEKRAEVKLIALKERRNSKHAHLTYCLIALDKGWDDAASSFFDDSIREKIELAL